MKLRPSPCANFVPRAAQQPQTSSSETGMIWVWLVMVNSTPFPSLKLVLWYQNSSHLSSQLSKTQREVGKAFPFCSDCHKRRIMWWAAVAPLRSERLLKATAHKKIKGRVCVAACSSLQCLQFTDRKRAIICWYQLIFGDILLIIQGWFASYWLLFPCLRVWARPVYSVTYITAALIST